MEKFTPTAWTAVRQSDEDTSSQEGLLQGEVPRVRDGRGKKRWLSGFTITIANLTICLATVMAVGFLTDRRPIQIQDSKSMPYRNTQLNTTRD